MYTANIDNKKTGLPYLCGKELEKVCMGMAKVADGNWRNNHFHLSIYDRGGFVRFSTHGLGKVNWSKDIPFSEISDDENRRKYAFYNSFYNMVSELDNMGIIVNSINIKYECGIIKEIDIRG